MGNASDETRPAGPPPLVSVVMTTFNHERFVAQAIESVLAQQAPFGCELLVGEDASTDGTRDVVTRYVGAHPDRVRPVLRERNVGAARNFAELLLAARGRYVAVLEGDDYWTTPDKLARQVAFMERHPACVLSAHGVRVVHEDGSVPPHVRRSHWPPVTGLREMLRGNHIQTCSVMLRAGVVREFPAWYAEQALDDWTMWVLHAALGEVRTMDDVMAVYRVHPGGIWSGARPATRHLYQLRAYDAVNRHFGGRYDGILGGTIARCGYEVAMDRERQGDLAAARRYAVQSLAHRPYGSLRTRAQMVRVICRAAAPAAYERCRNWWRAVRTPAGRVSGGSSDARDR